MRRDSAGLAKRAWNSELAGTACAELRNKANFAVGEVQAVLPGWLYRGHALAGWCGIAKLSQFHLRAKRRIFGLAG